MGNYNRITEFKHLLFCFFIVVLFAGSPIAFATEEKLPDDVMIFVVTVGNPPDTFTENVYVVFNSKTGDAVITDPGSEDKNIEKFIKSEKLKIRKILNTHGHYDHIGANRYYSDLYKVPVHAHVSDASFYENENKKNRPEFFFSKEDSLDCQGLDIKIFHTPGHSRGSVCYYINGYIFSGDTLFKQSIGRTWGKTEKEKTDKTKQQILGIKNKLLVLPGKTSVFPGHGSSTSIGYEKANNPFLGLF